METEEILKGNKLIAEFMGYTFNDTYCHGVVGALVGQHIHMALYESSWDWLMPCVGKILIGSYTLEGVYRMRKVQDCLITCSIEKTFDSVCDFIKWYNLNNK